MRKSCAEVVHTGLLSCAKFLCFTHTGFYVTALLCLKLIIVRNFYEQCALFMTMFWFGFRSVIGDLYTISTGITNPITKNLKGVLV